jgi:hypothetical protein
MYTFAAQLQLMPQDHNAIMPLFQKNHSSVNENSTNCKLCSIVVTSSLKAIDRINGSTTIPAAADFCIKPTKLASSRYPQARRH